MHVKGSLRTRKWTDKDGIEKYTTGILVEELQMREGFDDMEADFQDRQQGSKELRSLYASQLHSP